jgi:CAI-1 autoinducer synthase
LRRQAGLLRLGYGRHVAESERQILRIVTGDAATTAALRDFCAARGVFGSVFCPPAAPEGRSFVRFTVHCAMSDAQCEHFLEVMGAARRVLGDALHAEPAEARARAPEVQEFWGP